MWAVARFHLLKSANGPFRSMNLNRDQQELQAFLTGAPATGPHHGRRVHAEPRRWRRARGRHRCRLSEDRLGRPLRRDVPGTVAEYAGRSNRSLTAAAPISPATLSELPAA